MEKKKLQVWLPLLFSVTMIAGMFVGYKMRDGIPGKSFFYREKLRPIQEVMDLIQNRYVDTVNIHALSDTAIEAILAKLDPHSVYIAAEDLQSANDDISGNFYGIGVEFNIFDDTIHVVNVLVNGPSYTAGIKTGDKILKANDSILSGKKVPAERIRMNLRGSLGSSVAIELVRNGRKQFITVKRGVIPITSVDAAYMIDKATGYIRLNKFSKQTYREFMESLESLKKKGLSKLVLDLRGNGGGILDEAVEIADEFLEGDKIITYTEGSHSPRKEYRCRREGQFEKGALIVLSDEGSASASEILMGALQDWERATIIGRRSFGKGLVQEQYDLSNKSALRLTIARSYTPLGRSIQRPYEAGGKAFYAEISDRYSNGGVISVDSVKNDSTKIYTTKSGKKIFGGGGISPDYFVAADTSRPGTVSSKLFVNGLLGDFGYKYFIKNPDLLTRFKTSGDFARSFTIGAQDWNLFEKLASEDSISLKGISPKERSFITRTLKSSIGRQLYRTGGYFEVVNMEDESLKKAMEILK